MSKPPAPSKELPSVIFVTQVMDERHPVLGVVPSLVRALSERCSHVAVVTNEVGSLPGDLSAEVVSLGRGRGAGRLGRGAAYVATLESLARRRPWSALIAHMCPIYLTLAAPVTKRRRIPAFLWYAHPSYDLSLRVAERLAEGILTSLPGSYPGTHRNVQVVGQATDVDALTSFPPASPARPLRILALGRTSPSKGFTTVIRAVQAVRERGLEVCLRIVGPSTTELERAHRRELHELVRSLRIEPVTRIEEGVPHAGVRELLRNAHVLVNAMVAGSGDKVVFEAMATGRAVLASNPCLTSVLGDARPALLYPPNDVDALAARIEAIAAMDRLALATLGAELRDRVVRHHSLSGWAERVLAVVSSHPAGRGQGADP